MSQIILNKKEMANLTADITKQVDSAIKSALSQNKDKILNRTQIANFFNVGTNTIDQWVKQGMPVIFLENTKRYSTASCYKWFHEQEKTIKPTKKRPIRIVNE
ncbi:MAG: terminase small subunit [Lactobacillus johnsonii]|nr:terminase small subunit [Lactobacillus johnsonii]MDY2640584.1 terminase small subunit [Ligilactobacillus salivarius]MDY5351080.1 terminase small subunit [Lactobacillus johnsonii]